MYALIRSAVTSSQPATRLLRFRNKLDFSLHSYAIGLDVSRTMFADLESANNEIFLLLVVQIITFQYNGVTVQPSCDAINDQNYLIFISVESDFFNALRDDLDGHLDYCNPRPPRYSILQKRISKASARSCDTPSIKTPRSSLLHFASHRHGKRSQACYYFTLINNGL